MNNHQTPHLSIGAYALFVGSLSLMLLFIWTGNTEVWQRGGATGGRSHWTCYSRDTRMGANSMSKQKKPHEPILRDFGHNRPKPWRDPEPVEVAYRATCCTCEFAGQLMDGADLALMRMATALGSISCPQCAGTRWRFGCEQVVDDAPTALDALGQCGHVRFKDAEGVDDEPCG